MCASNMDTCEWTWHPLKEIESYNMPQNEPAIKTLHEKNKITNNELEDDGSQTMEDDDSAFDNEEIMSKITISYIVNGWYKIMGIILKDQRVSHGIWH